MGPVSVGQSLNAIYSAIYFANGIVSNRWSAAFRNDRTIGVGLSWIVSPILRWIASTENTFGSESRATIVERALLTRLSWNRERRKPGLPC